MAKSITSTTLLPQRANFSTYAEYHRACLAAKAAMFGGKSRSLARCDATHSAPIGASFVSAMPAAPFRFYRRAKLGDL